VIGSESQDRESQIPDGLFGNHHRLGHAVGSHQPVDFRLIVFVISFLELDPSLVGSEGIADLDDLQFMIFYACREIGIQGVIPAPARSDGYQDEQEGQKARRFHQLLDKGYHSSLQLANPGMPPIRFIS
jgi:hypothetical protein